MVLHMKTTLNMEDGVMARLGREAVRQARTMRETWSAMPTRPS